MGSVAEYAISLQIQKMDIKEAEKEEKSVSSVLYGEG
jgi:hypothetical protein